MNGLYRETLVRSIAAGAKIEGYEVFYGGPFSQWAPSPIEHGGITYPTAEHWMMAAKARVFCDQEALGQILATKDPAMAKAIGRRVKNYDDAAWAEQRYSIVVVGNVHKFWQNAAFKRELLSTGSKVIVEGSPVDTIWGVGLDEHDPRCHDPTQWRGDNLLGFALMAVRQFLTMGREP